MQDPNLCRATQAANRAIAEAKWSFCQTHIGMYTPRLEDHPAPRLHAELTLTFQGK